MQKLFPIHLFFILTLLTSSNYAFAVSEQQVRDAARSMGVSTYEAKKILQGSFLLIKEIQNNFSTIGDSTYSHNQKIGENGLIQNTITAYFSSSSAKVQVSSINHSNIISHTIYNYLHRLANMSRKGVYKTVKLEFGKELYFRDIFLDSGEINISVDALQLFEGCKNTYEGKYCYSDVTKKTFVVKVVNTSNGFRSYVNAINVKETMRVDSSGMEITY